MFELWKPRNLRSPPAQDLRESANPVKVHVSHKHPLRLVSVRRNASVPDADVFSHFLAEFKPRGDGVVFRHRLPYSFAARWSIHHNRSSAGLSLFVKVFRITG